MTNNDSLSKKIERIVNLAYYGDRALTPFCTHLRDQLYELLVGRKTEESAGREHRKGAD